MQKPFSKEELEYISSTREEKTAREQAVALGRSVESVKSLRKRKGLGISKERKDALCRARALAMNLPGEKNQNWKGGVSKSPIIYRRVQLQRYPERCAARKAVAEAIRTGDLSRQPCVVCGKAQTHAHHEDYSRPLDVIFLCQKHHRELHELKKGKGRK
jgi:hypothetical protein